VLLVCIPMNCVLIYGSVVSEDNIYVIKIQKSKKRRKDKSICISLTPLYGYCC